MRRSSVAWKKTNVRRTQEISFWGLLLKLASPIIAVASCDKIKVGPNKWERHLCKIHVISSLSCWWSDRQKSCLGSVWLWKGLTAAEWAGHMLSPRATLSAQGRRASIACLIALSKGTEYTPVGHAADCPTPDSSYTPRQQNTPKSVGVPGTC